jgi:hypothetical protein
MAINAHDDVPAHHGPSLELGGPAIGELEGVRVAAQRGGAPFEKRSMVIRVRPSQLA